MALPFSMGCNCPEPIVFECSDGRFQLIDQTPVSPFMGGFGYLLVEEPLATLLQQLEIEGVAFEPAVLFRPSTGEEINTHIRLRVAHFFRKHEMLDLNLSGRRMLTLNDQYYFVSPELMSALRENASSFPYLTFGEGLSEFAASAT